MAVEPPPEADVVIDEALVRALLRDQRPDLADLPLERAGEGWDNVTVRVGTALAARVPRRAASVPLIGHEQRWLPVLASRLPLGVPAPVHVGRPTAAFPWPWSVVPWFPGRPAVEAPPGDPHAAALALGSFLAALHRPAPDDAPRNPYRSVVLAERDALTRGRIAAIASTLHQAGLDDGALLRCWSAAVAVPSTSGAPRWLHGDLHPGNVVVDRGHIAAVIDFGDVCAGDRAVDLAVTWMLFADERHRAALRAAAGTVDDATWRRAAGWALTLGVMHLAASAGAEAHRRIGVATLRHLLDDRSLTAG